MDAIVATPSTPLKLVSADALPIVRRRCGRGFLYCYGTGRQVHDPGTLARIRRLAIPPAYEDVHIAASADAHLQATGRDQAGRVQYRYHADWEQVREEQKAGQLAAICAALPRIRRRIRADLAVPEPVAAKALAGVVMLIDRTHIRIGCEDYVHSGHSRGASTLLKRNIQVRGDWLDLAFRGKGGKDFAMSVRIPLLARAMPVWLGLRGARLFQYCDEAGRIRRVVAGEVNAYLQRIADGPVSAKTFRTLAASAVAIERFAAIEPGPSAAARRRQIKRVMTDIAAMLGNTPAIVRKSYVHGRVIEAFEDGALAELYAAALPVRGLSRREAALAAVFAG